MTSVRTEFTNAATIERARRVTAAEGYDVGTRFSSVIERAEGAWMWDVEGNRILDVTAASGVMLLGNAHPAVTAAVADCVREHGTSFASTLSLPRIELAERLCERYPAGEKVVFCRTGSEATTTAARLARAASGRDLLLTCGYHGWHDWQTEHTRFGYDPYNRTIGFGYNLTTLERLLDELGERIAGVFVTPEPAWVGMDELRRMSQACARHGVLFMLDEVMTGLRYGPRGVNGTGGVPADVITMSKGLANGHALSAVIGRRDVLDAYDDAGIAGTYTREVPPMAAALAVLDVIDDGSVHEHCERMGRMLMDGMRAALAAEGIPAHVGGPPMMFDVVVPSEGVAWQIYEAAHDFGAYFEDSGTQLVSAAFGEAEVEHAIAAFTQGVRKVAATTELEPGELTDERRDEFAAEWFGGILTDPADLDARLERVLDEVAAAPGPAGAGRSAAGG